MSQALRQISAGFFSPLQGLGLLLSSPRMFFLALSPFLIAGLLFFGGLWWAFDGLNPLVNDFLARFISVTGTTFSILLPFLTLLAWAAFLTMGFLALYGLVNILAGPFLSLLVERAFMEIKPKRARQTTFSAMFKMFGLSLIKMVIFLALGAVNLVLWFFPPLNILGSLVVLLMVAYDCLDYAMEVDFLDLHQRYQFFKTHFWYFFGLAMAVLATTLLPGSFFIMLPAFVAGAAKMYLDIAPQQ